MINQTLLSDVDAILKDGEKDIDDNINGVMWLLGFNLFVLSSIVLFMWTTRQLIAKLPLVHILQDRELF